MRFNFITLFPDKIQSYFSEGLQQKAIESGVFSVNIIQLRNFSGNKHNRVDDTIYGGGPGMLLRVEPIHKAILSLGENKGTVVLTSPSGIPFNQSIAMKLKETENL